MRRRCIRSSQKWKEVSAVATDRSEFIPYTVVRAFQDALSDYVKGIRGGMFEDLIARYEADGSKSWDVPLPGEDGEVATLSLSFSTPEPKIDNKAELVTCAQWNAPALVQHRGVREARRRGTKDGVLVPGVIVTEERPQTFSLRWANDGKRRVEVAYGNGMLNERLLDTPLPLVEDVEGGDDA